MSDTGYVNRKYILINLQYLSEKHQVFKSFMRGDKMEKSVQTTEFEKYELRRDF